VAAQDGTVLTIPYTIKIKASNGGGSVGYKDVTITIVICGSEVLSLDNANTATFSLDIPMTGATATDNSLATYF